MESQLPLLGLIMGVLGLAGTVWWRIQTHVSSVRTELEARIQAVSAQAHAVSGQASLASMQLADYRTYVAEHYISKQGFRETTDTLSATLHTINTNLTHLNERIDRVIDNQHTAPRQKERSSQ